MATSLRKLLEDGAASATVPPTDLGPVLAAGERAVRRRRIVGVAAAAAIAMIAVVIPWAIAGQDSRTDQPIGDPVCEAPWITGANESSSESGELARVSADLTESMALSDKAANVPAFSPDGSEIVFARNEGDQLAGAYLQSALMVIDTDDGDVRRLTDGRRNNLDPTWSPDGRRIAFSSQRYDLEENRWGRLELRVVNADGTRQRTIDLTAPVGSNLAWLDDHSLLYEHDFTVWRVDLDAEEPVTPRPVAEVPGWINEGYDPFSTDRSAMVVTVEGRAFRQHLEIVDLASGRQRRIPKGRGGEALGWTRDGAFLFGRNARDPSGPRHERRAYEVWAVSDRGWGEATRLQHYNVHNDDFTYPYAFNPACDLPG